MSEFARGAALFALSSIRTLRVDKAAFRFRPGFDIDGFARQSFGVWQGDPVDVVWRFGVFLLQVGRTPLPIVGSSDARSRHRDDAWCAERSPASEWGGRGGSGWWCGA